MFIQDSLPPPLLHCIRDGLGKQAGLFDPLDESQANQFQCLHKAVSLAFSSLYKTVCRK
jgi:hypothetical protein